MVPGVVGRKEQTKHVDQAEAARSPDRDAEYERQPDRQFTVSHQESDGHCKRQHYSLQHGNHEWIRRAILQKTVDPPLESAAQGELRTKYFVLGKNQKQATDRDS